MQDLVKRLDPTRPVTYAAPEGNVFRGINSVIEVRGWNYYLATNNTDRYHADIRRSRKFAPNRAASSARAAFMRTTGSVVTSAVTTRTGRAGRRQTPLAVELCRRAPVAVGRVCLGRF